MADKPDLRLPQDLALALIRYLGTRPYAEVHQLVHAIQRLEEVRPVTEGEDPEE